MDSTLGLHTLNVRSVTQLKKRKTVFDWLKKCCKGIIFLQETHSVSTSDWSNEWSGDVYMAHGSSKSKGVAILFPANFPYTLLEKTLDDNGRYIILKISVYEEILVMVNAYFPTKDYQKEQLILLKTLKIILQPLAEETIIFGGDLNIVLNPLVDKLGGTSSKSESKQYRCELNALTEAYQLEDVTRVFNPDKKLTTWHCPGKKISSRLDYWFVSEHILNRISKPKIKTAILTDHDLVQFEMNINQSTKRGPGYWKFNSSLLTDPDFVIQIKNVIKESITEYSYLEDKGMVWDLVKMRVRGETIKYSSSQKRNRLKREYDITRDLEDLTTDLQNDRGKDTLEKISYLKKELEELKLYETKGSILRSKAKWTEEGEKNSSYFLTLEKRNGQNKTITQLKIKNNNTFDDKLIMRELKSFYTDLYSEKQNLTTHCTGIESIFINKFQLKLSAEDAAHCDNPITENECLKALKTLSNNKTPGTDGLSAEFYKFFWLDVKGCVFDSIVYAFDKGEMSIDQRRGIISLSPKKGKDRLYLKNWRPITLLNTDYKILAKVLALRISKVIGKVINTDQSGYIKGRYIGDNIRTVADIIHFIKIRKLDGLILLIDFEKAFDSVNWSFMNKVLKSNNFGNTFQRWVNVIYNKCQISVLNNGFLTDFFNPSRGIRQGCPLSAYLFLLVVEVMAQAIRKNKYIEGFQLKEKVIKITQLADDTTIMIKNSKSIPPLFELLSKFETLSGLKANIEKTKAFNFTTRTPGNLKGINLKWEKGPIHLLGMAITDDINIHIEQNIQPKIELMKNTLGIWKQRKLSLKGKITVINALAVSLLVYPATLMQFPNQKLREVEMLLYDFLWGKGKNKVAKNVIESDIENGGLKMPNIYNKVKSWRILWIKRALGNNDCAWVSILDELLDEIKFIDLIRCTDLKNNPIRSKLPPFYDELLTYWLDLCNMNLTAFDEKCIINQLIWFNKEITIKGKSIFWKAWYKQGIKTVQDLLDDTNNFLNHEEIALKFDIKCNFLDILAIRQSIPFNWRRIIMGLNYQIPRTIGTVNIKKGDNIKSIEITNLQTKDVYWQFQLNQAKLNIKPAGIKKWNQVYNFNKETWKTIFKVAFQACSETKLQTLQYEIIHRVYPCNYWLFTCKILQSPDCEICKVEDSIQHYFTSCCNLVDFWHYFNKWVNRVAKCQLIITPTIIIFGITDSIPMACEINFCIILAKNFIKNCKKNGKITFDLYDFLVYLKTTLQLKYLYHSVNCTIEKFNRKWLVIYENI